MTSHRRSSRLFPSLRHLLGPSLAVATILLCAAAASANLQLDPCELPGFDTEGRCGQLNVRVDRSDPASETLALQVVELPATTDEVSPEPLFYLVGGPGRAATSGVEFFSDSLRGIQAHHRVVLLDLRGTGEGRPIDCGFSLAEKLDLLLAFQAPAGLEACRTEAAIDPSHQTTRDAVLDLEALRVGLGAERVHLLGISYGTRVAQVYAKLYPDRVATMTLRGSTTLGDTTLHRVAWGGERQVQRIAERCSTDPSCADRFPDLSDRLEALGGELANHPLAIPVGTGDSVRLTPNHLEGLLRQTVYSPRGAASVPWLVDRLLAGNPPSHLFTAIERQLEGLALEPMLSVFCAEDIPWANEHPSPDPTFAQVHQRFEPICSRWNVEPDPEVLAINGIGAPTLVLSGAEDPATPADIAQQASTYLDRARFVVTPGLGHFPTWTSCFAGLAAALLDTGSPEELDTECATEDLSIPFLLVSPVERLQRLGLISGATLAVLAAAIVYRRRRLGPG